MTHMFQSFNVGLNSHMAYLLKRPVVLHFCAENSRLKVKKHCNGLETAKWVDKETALSNNQ